jgi:hypothetical protein
MSMPRLTRLILAAMLGASCAGPVATPGPTPTPSPAPTTAATPTPSAAAPLGSIAPTEAEALRRLAFAYWDAYNAYDIDRVLSYLEPSERARREAGIRDEIGRLKTFGVKLGISEESPPALSAPDTGEMLMTMQEPLGSRTMKMVFLHRDDKWWVIAADEVPK